MKSRHCISCTQAITTRFSLQYLKQSVLLICGSLNRTIVPPIMADENNEIAGPPEPCSSSTVTREQINAPPVENSVNLVRLFAVLKDLYDIIKPPRSKEDIMKNRKYYLATHSHRYKLQEDEKKAVQKWTQDSKEYTISQSCSFFVPDTESPPRAVEPDPPMPFEIRENWDHSVATKRIKELFKEMDEILKDRRESHHIGKDDLKRRLQLNAARLQELRRHNPLPPPPARPSFSLDQSDDEFPEEQDMTRML